MFLRGPPCRTDRQKADVPEAVVCAGCEVAKAYTVANATILRDIDPMFPLLSNTEHPYVVGEARHSSCNWEAGAGKIAFPMYVLMVQQDLAHLIDEYESARRQGNGPDAT